MNVVQSGGVWVTAGDHRQAQVSVRKVCGTYLSYVIVEKWVNVVVVIDMCECRQPQVSTGEGASDVLCQHFDGGQPQVSICKSQCW